MRCWRPRRCSIRRDRLYLLDISEACEAVARFTAMLSESEFLTSELNQSAVLQKLIVIGEAAGRLSAALIDAHAEIEWRDIVAFRNFAVHAYFSVDWSIVWETSRVDVPRLRQQVAAILAEEDRPERA